MYIIEQWQDRLIAADPTKKFRELYANNILGFCHDVLHVYPTNDPGADQIEIYDAVLKAVRGEGPRFIAISSGTGTGKTRYIAAPIALWFISCIKNSQVITTSSSWNQVKNQLWTKMRSLISEADPELKKIFERINDTELVLKGNPDSYAVGKSSKKPDNIRGFHAPFLLFIYDEMSGIDEGVLESSLGALTTNAIALKISNPTKSVGKFYDSFNKDKELNSCFVLDAECSRYVSPQWLHERAVEWGKDSMMYRVFVKGQFPGRSLDQLIALDWIVKAEERHMDSENDLFKKFKPNLKVCSIDVATYGIDFTVFTNLHIDEVNNLALVVGQITEAKMDPTEITQLAKMYIAEWESDVTIVDAQGNGEGVWSNLKHADYNVIAFKSTYSPTEKVSHYHNLKAEAYSKAADRFRIGTIAMNKNLNRLKGELTTIKYKIRPENQKICIVDPRSDEYKSDPLQTKTKKSPDHADSFVIGLMAPILMGNSKSTATNMSDVFNAIDSNSNINLDLFGGYGGGGMF